MAPIPQHHAEPHQHRTAGIIPLLTTLLLLAGLACGCAPVYYPNMAHAPLFRHAGETHLAMSLTTDGYEAMGALSPLPSIGVLGAYAWGGSVTADKPPTDHTYGELGLCYYMATEHDQDTRLEVIGGYGLGDARSYKSAGSDFLDEPPYDTTRSAYRRYFVQGNVGAPFRTSLLKLWGEGGASLRVAHVRFTTLRVGENAPYDGTARTFVEPSFFVRFGHPIFVCEAQLGCSLTLPTRPMLDYRSLYMSLGFHARFGGGEPLP